MPVENISANLKKISFVAVAFMVALFILGVIFYKERVLFADASYIVFNIINHKGLMIQEKRYGSFITQMFPYLGQKFNLPLKSILILYGISFNLFFLSATAAIVFAFKQYRLAIILALYYFLFFSEAFIWINEIAQGVAWMFLLLSAVIYLGNKKANTFVLLAVLLPLFILTIFTHFVIIIPLTFLWVYLIIKKDGWPFSRTKTILLSAVLILVVALKFACTNTPYDTEHLHGATHFSLRDVYYSFRTPVVVTFLSRCISNYWVSVLVFIVGITALLYKGERRLALWTLTATVGYIIIIGLAYKEFDAKMQLFHIESEWSCMAIIIATPFVFTLLPMLKTAQACCLLAGVFAIRICYIISFITPFSARYTMDMQILERMKQKGITKLALYNDPVLMNTTRLYWALTDETIIVSALNNDKPQPTFFFVNPDDKNTLEQVKNNNGFYDGWGVSPGNSLNAAYFSIDTTRPYKVMSKEDLFN